MAGSNINRVILTGNLTRDPEMKALPSGTSVCSLRIANNTRRKNNETGSWEDVPNYFDVTVWGQQGENCKQYLSKGRAVAVDDPSMSSTTASSSRSKRSPDDVGRARADPNPPFTRVSPPVPGALCRSQEARY